MAKLTINVNIEVDADESEDITEELTLSEIASDLGDAMVQVVNAKKGIFGTLNFYIKGEQESTFNFD